MRILTVTHFFEPHGGGIERVAGHLCRAFEAAGHHAAWAASGSPASGVAAIQLPSWNGIERATGLPMPVPGRRALARLWRAVGDCEGVVIHDALYLTSVAAMLAARLRRRPVLLVQHVGDLPFRNRLLRGLAALGNRVVGRAMLAAADRVVFISATTADHFAGVRLRAPARLLFNGVDTTVFRAASESRDALRRRLGLPAGQKMILFVGRFVEKKGLATIEALARARPDLCIVLAGKGPIDPAAWQLGNVLLVQGISGRALAELYQTVDQLLLPSVGEGFPLVIQEAMACGLPVICGLDSSRADPGAQGFLTGVPIDPDRPEINVQAVMRALDAPPMAAADRRRMAAYAGDTYRWSAMAEAISAMLAEQLPAARSGDRPARAP